MNQSTLYMETTKIPPEKTAGEIQSVLCRYGAQAIMTEFDEKGRIAALSFRINVGGRDVHFQLPCRWEAIMALLRKRDRYGRKSLQEVEDTSRRVAWRQLFRWVEAQMALVETQMVKVEEVFLPYLIVGTDGKTVYEKLEAKGFTGLLIEDKR